MAKSLEFRDGKKSKGEEEMVTLVKGLLKEDGEKPYVYLGNLIARSLMGAIHLTSSTPFQNLPCSFLYLREGAQT